MAAGEAATCTPAGRASVKVNPVTGKVFGFVTVKVNDEVPFTGIVPVVKLFVSCTGWTPPVGVPQPMKVTLSRSNMALAPGFCASAALIMKWVSPLVFVCPVKFKLTGCQIESK